MALRLLPAPEDLTYLALDGRLDVAGTRTVEPEFTTCTIEEGRPTVIDLADVLFLGSIGIRMLVNAAKALARKGYRLVLLNPRDHVRRALEFAGLVQIMQIAGSEIDAFRMARGGQPG